MKHQKADGGVQGDTSKYPEGSRRNECGKSYKYATV